MNAVTLCAFAIAAACAVRLLRQFKNDMGTLLAAAACEAFIHAVTATLAGMAAVAVSNAVTACAVGMPLFDGLAFGEGLAVSLAGFVLVLAATLVPTLAALRKEPATVLAMGE